MLPGGSAPGCLRAKALFPKGWSGAVEAAPEAGVGGRGTPGSGPRSRPARSAVLPRLSAMLIFGLGRPCPGISRHASRRPVCRPEPGGRRDRTAAARLPRSARRTLPRPVALCLSLCLAVAAATTPRGLSQCPIAGKRHRGQGTKDHISLGLAHAFRGSVHYRHGDLRQPRGWRGLWIHRQYKERHWAWFEHLKSQSHLQ